VGAGGVISSMTPGTNYTVTTNNGSCSSTASSSFSINAQFAVPSTPTIATVAANCSAAGTATISNYVGTQTYTFTPSGPIVGAGGLISSMTPGTNYTVTTNNGSCSSTASTSFYISEAISFQLNAAVIQPTCGKNNGCISFSTFPTGTYFYTWSSPLNWTSSSVCDLSPGIYGISIMNSDGCLIDTTIILSAEPFNVLETINPASCEASNGSISLVISNGAAPYNYNWSNGANSTNILENVVSGNYQVTIVDQDGCSVTENYFVPKINSFNFEIFPPYSTVVQGESIQLTAIGGTSYIWSPSESLSCSDCSNPIAAPTENTTYTIVAENSDGCIDTNYIILSVNEDNFFYVPNAFTPDGNEFNNVFIPFVSNSFDSQSYTFFIFNRWGEIIFESRDISKGWDGTYNGRLQQNGLYTWKISCKSKDLDEINEYHGHVLLLR
jgi:gliding motility-associated-like protein